jgi:hypothetical protein
MGPGHVGLLRRAVWVGTKFVESAREREGLHCEQLLALEVGYNATGTNGCSEEVLEHICRFL